MLKQNDNRKNEGDERVTERTKKSKDVCKLEEKEERGNFREEYIPREEWREERT